MLSKSSLGYRHPGVQYNCRPLSKTERHPGSPIEDTKTRDKRIYGSCEIQLTKRKNSRLDKNTDLSKQRQVCIDKGESKRKARGKQ